MATTIYINFDNEPDRPKAPTVDQFGLRSFAFAGGDWDRERRSFVSPLLRSCVSAEDRLIDQHDSSHPFWESMLEHLKERRTSFLVEKKIPIGEFAAYIEGPFRKAGSSLELLHCSYRLGEFWGLPISTETEQFIDVCPEGPVSVVLVRGVKNQGPPEEDEPAQILFQASQSALDGMLRRFLGESVQEALPSNRPLLGDWRFLEKVRNYESRKKAPVIDFFCTQAIICGLPHFVPIGTVISRIELIGAQRILNDPKRIFTTYRVTDEEQHELEVSAALRVKVGPQGFLKFD